MPSGSCTAKSPGCFVIIEDTRGKSPVRYYYKQEAATNPSAPQDTQIALTGPTMVALFAGPEGGFQIGGNIHPFYYDLYDRGHQTRVAVRGGITKIPIVAYQGYVWKQIDSETYLRSSSKPASGAATRRKGSSTQNLRTPPGAASPGSVTPSRNSRPHDGQDAADMTEVNKRLQNLQ